MSGPLKAVVGLLSSLKLAVVLVLLLGVLTWLGTLAQVENGLYEAQKLYFESWFVIAELPLSWWGDYLGTLRIPLPGAYPVMILLFVNLIVGGMVRLKVKLRNIGVLITHVGIGLLLIAGFVKLHYSVAGYVALYEDIPANVGSDKVVRTSEFVSFHDYELALLKDEGSTIVERTIPEAALVAAREDTVKITDPDLPFQIEVHHWFDNCKAVARGSRPAPTPVVDGVFLLPKKRHEKREANIAGCYVIVTAAEGARHEGIVVGNELRPFTRYRYPFVFEVGGVRYALDLRRVIRELPFEVELNEFKKTDHPGTLTPADFRSFVTVREGEVEQPVQIYMNTPLRRDGFVLYQTNWGPQLPGGRPGPGPLYSVFEASENPSDKWPEWACWIIAAGILAHLVIKLSMFLASMSKKGML
ncbi:MAG: cytochrome c biogenesis protein ResB [bacterium]|nr:cytochrome c biogenesis protein ResB [bacterium]